MIRKREFFKEYILKHQNVISCNLSKLFAQETDWTCQIACIRTILSGLCENVPEESYFTTKYKMTPGPYYSHDIKKLGILDSYNAIYGCDIKEKKFDEILFFMEDGYYIMLESMVGFSHWMVLLGYYALENNIEKSKLLMFDPYYNEVRLMNVDEFLSMWIDGNHAENNVINDFIAIKKL